MKRLSFNLLGLTLILGVLLFHSCKKDPVIPTVNFIAEVDGYDVNITVESTDAQSFAWNYGDGTSSTAAGSHTYTYEQSGDYTISVVVTSSDGETASKSVDVTIAASLEEIIAGTGTTGKTWVLTQAESTFTGKIGGGGVTNDVAIYPNMSLIPNGVLSIFGLGAEYTDEFTFYRDGKLAVDMKNGRKLAGIVYGKVVSPNDIVESDDWGSLPLSSIPSDNITNATWQISYDDRTVQWYDEFVTQSLQSTTFTFPEDDPNKIAELKLSAGAYLCFHDLYYPDPIATAMGLPGPVNNSLFILKEVTPDAMHLAVGLNSWPDYAHLPSLLLHLTLVPKN